MNADELKQFDIEAKMENLFDYIERAEHIDASSIDDDDYEEIQALYELAVDTKQEIITAFDAQAAQIERLRWHYPEQGEIPPLDHKIKFIAEIKNGDIGFEMLYWFITYKAAGVDVHEWKDGCWSGMTYTIGDIKRWREVDG